MPMGAEEPWEAPVPEQGPEPWRAPVRCPDCHGMQTRFVAMNYEISVYECELCGVEFEVDDDG